MYMYPLSPNPAPIQGAISHQAEFMVLHSRSVLVLHFEYSNVYMKRVLASVGPLYL